MPVYVSTTFHGRERTELIEVLDLLSSVDLDGIELGSTHKLTPDLKKVIHDRCSLPIVVHNFFPPSKDPDFVVNIASLRDDIRLASVEYARSCIEYAGSIGAKVYTVHPGFLSDANPRKEDSDNYDFAFGEARMSREGAFCKMLESLNFLTEEAVKNNVKLAIETEGSLTSPDLLLMDSLEEYRKLFQEIPNNIYLNLNIAHSFFASKVNDFSLYEFVCEHYEKIVLVELSDNDGFNDQHKPLSSDSYVFDFFDSLPAVPFILEFRRCSVDDIRSSVSLVRKALGVLAKS